MSFSRVEAAPPDPIFSLARAFERDDRDRKVNLTVGAYKDDDGQPQVFRAVREAKRRVAENQPNFEYLPITGNPNYVRLATELHLGSEHPLLQTQDYFACQTVGGTGALSLASLFLKEVQQGKVDGDEADLYVSNPTWANHANIFERNGLKIAPYSYYNPETKALDFEAMCTDLKALKKGSVVLFHGCCHNPTGFDPSPEQWETLCEITLEKELVPLFDFAYQGFGKGLEEDAYGVRLFAERCPQMILCSSFSKNFGLYGERVGTLLIKTKDSETATTIASKMKAIIRSQNSNPPSEGCRIVEQILASEDLREDWKEELSEMRQRIATVRELFVKALSQSGLSRDFGHLLIQQGMFAYSGLSREEVNRLREDKAVYMTGSGRMNMAGLNSKNLPLVAQAFTEVLNRTYA